MFLPFITLKTLHVHLSDKAKGSGLIEPEAMLSYPRHHTISSDRWPLAWIGLLLLLLRVFQSLLSLEGQCDTELGVLPLSDSLV